MNHSKGFVGILALILVAVLLIGGGYVWTKKNSDVDYKSDTTTSGTLSEKAQVNSTKVPHISSVSKSSGPVGTTVILRGTFPADTRITFDGYVVGRTVLDLDSFTLTIPTSVSSNDPSSGAGSSGQEIRINPGPHSISVWRIPDTSTASDGNSVSFTVETAAATTSQTIDWKTFANTGKGYSINYSSDAKIDAQDPSCVRIDTKEFGSVHINAGSANPCGQPTGIGIGMAREQETITIAGKQYSASGFRDADNSYSFLSFGLTTGDKIYVTYGVDHSDKSNPKSRKNLGALTDSEYQTALNSAKEIVATLKTSAW